MNLENSPRTRAPVTQLAIFCGLLLALPMTMTSAQQMTHPASIDQQVSELLGQMTLEEKIGQMSQVHAGEGYPPDYLRDDLRSGRIGAILNQVDVGTINELQRIAVEESRLGIPLLVGRDVIHGFKTVMPIPLGQAASWNPDLVKLGASVAAREAASTGVNWTFAPMIDVTRDPRWGRIAESLGEDAYLASQLAVAMIEGFQGNDLSASTSIAACAKHFAGYGAVESGRDYATTYIPEIELRNVHLPPFKAAADAGVATFMSAFTDLNGIPASGNEFLLRKVLREEWNFDGFVVSDWDSVSQLQIHGLTENDRESAFTAATAGVDMEMSGSTYRNNLKALVENGRIDLSIIDQAVANILSVKFRLGLFTNWHTNSQDFEPIADQAALAAARQMAVQSTVLLKNTGSILPLAAEKLRSVAVIGPLAEAPYEQLGTWIFDGDAQLSVTPLAALREALEGKADLHYARAMKNSRSRGEEGFEDAVAAAQKADVALLFLGEESILSGEAHSRADINLPGNQAELVRRIRETGKPVVAIILAGRPLTLTNIVDEVDGILFAWHGGTMTGPALADLLLGVASPSGKLPVTFPRMVGQIPIYYSQKNTGKPPAPDLIVHIDEIEERAPQTSLGMTAFHLDAGYTPLYPFGHGLSYTTFQYNRIRVDHEQIPLGGKVIISADLTNAGSVTAEEVVQLYLRDLVGSVTRPVRELKGFRRVTLAPGKTQTVSFELSTDDLAFYGREMKLTSEPGDYHAWIGGSSASTLQTSFRVIDRD